MKHLWVPDRFRYDGAQLRPLFIYEKYDLLGDAVIAWRGPCDVSLAHMIDFEDKKQNAKICGEDMLHFIFEIHRVDLAAAVSFQRLFAAQLQTLLQHRWRVSNVTRDGDDLFIEDGKLSISIATASVTCCLIHFALNVLNRGTPVKTSCLEEYGVNVEDFAQAALKTAALEWQSIIEATCKVRTF